MAVRWQMYELDGHEANVDDWMGRRSDFFTLRSPAKSVSPLVPQPGTARRKGWDTAARLEKPGWPAAQTYSTSPKLKVGENDGEALQVAERNWWNSEIFSRREKIERFLVGPPDF
ncbi:uncharacterized protein I303_101159 [Kwoniella dejecticola CBS 10117]|uniref:Uncharacterized protein n=1 Tax=Kwoniella dejecticola CBS 10117 TaxID=1296121 RepID=A0A1A6AGY0_9TREE|nr:uncharacterized protein I303_01166 [Kwoniella dejecticola CBS 10117]OBR89340.1 hypothetical protein I303_01166 [Kwoniella dejecticola CBS 10117]